MNKVYEVQEYCLMGGWTNVWSDTENGLNAPTLFTSEEAAQAELDWFLKECEQDFKDGYMEDVPERDSFRIVAVEMLAK